jgi:hypothetical protein
MKLSYLQVTNATVRDHRKMLIINALDIVLAPPSSVISFLDLCPLISVKLIALTSAYSEKMHLI